MTGTNDDLNAVPLFAGSHAHHHRVIRRTGTVLDVPSGTVLCERGAVAREFLVVLAGDVSVTQDGARYLGGPGSHFGAASVMAHAPHTATVRAENEVRILVFETRAFAVLLEELPILARRLMSELAKRAPADPFFGLCDVRTLARTS